MNVMVLVEMLELLAVAMIVVLIVRFARRRRDARLARQWESALEASAFPGTDLAYIRRVYQHARRGSKAEILWWTTNLVQDTWFDGRHPQAGTFVAILGWSGWGPHNSNPNVFYVQRTGVIVTVPGDSPKCWARHQRRQARRRRARSLIRT